MSTVITYYHTIHGPYVLVDLGISVSFSAKPADDRPAAKQLTVLFGALHQLREADRRGEGIHILPSANKSFTSVSILIVSARLFD